MTEYFKGVTEALASLPVTAIAPQVVHDVKKGGVSILTAETGSGKTLVASTQLADASDHPVVVLVPRRFLAINAAETVAALSGATVGKEVGFGIGRKSSGRSQISPQTKLIFATYGYALSSGLLETAKTIVCDEVHEAAIDTSLARAMLHRRLKTDPELRVLEMSATLNAPKQAAYWQDIRETSLHHAQGHSHPCEFRQSEEKNLPKLVRDLIKNEKRKGVAVFLPGVGKVKKTAEDLRTLLRDSSMKDVEVATIYADMTDEERKAALAPPQPGNRKVLIGTNVIESGMNLMWLDTGVSDGLTKIPYCRPDGAQALTLEDIPQWRIIQQMGRVRRAGPGLFVLASKKDMEHRPQETSPEITRVSLQTVVMQAASYGIDPTQLKFDAPVERAALLRAKKELMNLRLVTDDWQLTEKGQFVHDIPLNPDAACMLYKAPPDILGDAILLAAVAEQGGLRADFMQGHKQDDRSDTLDGVKAMRRLGLEATEEECARLNVGFFEYTEVVQRIKDLHAALGSDPGLNYRPAKDAELVQLLMQGGVNRLFEARNETLNNLATGYSGYPVERSSAAHKSNERFALASLREIPQRKGEPLTVAQNVTRASTEDFCTFAARNPELFTGLTFSRDDKGRDKVTGKYLGEREVTMRIPRQPTRALQQLIEPAYSAYKKEADEKFPESSPTGTHNTEAWDAQRESAERKRNEGKRKKG